MLKHFKIIEDVFRCIQCGRIFDTEDYDEDEDTPYTPLCVCQRCKIEFRGANCPQCHKFGTKQADHSCAVCGGEAVIVDALWCPRCSYIFDTFEPAERNTAICPDCGMRGIVDPNWLQHRLNSSLGELAKAKHRRPRSCSDSRTRSGTKAPMESDQASGRATKPNLIDAEAEIATEVGSVEKGVSMPFVLKEAAVDKSSTAKTLSGTFVRDKNLPSGVSRYVADRGKGTVFGAIYISRSDVEAVGDEIQVVIRPRQPR